MPVFQERFRSFLERIDAPLGAENMAATSGTVADIDGCAGIMIETRAYPAMGIPGAHAKALQPGVGIVAASCVVVVATLWFAGSGHLLRPAVPAVATLFGLFLYLRRPILYVQYALWVWFLAPLARRVVDLRFGWMESNVVLLAPLLVSGIAGLTLLRKRGQVAGGIPAAFVLCGTAILYGFVVGALLRPSAETAYAFLNWLCPLLFGLHLYMNWPQYQQHSEAISRTFLWAVLIIGVYGIYQFLSPPAWDCLLVGKYSRRLAGIEFWSTRTPDGAGLEHHQRSGTVCQHYDGRSSSSVRRAVPPETSRGGGRLHLISAVGGSLRLAGLGGWSVLDTKRRQFPRDRSNRLVHRAPAGLPAACSQPATSGDADRRPGLKPSPIWGMTTASVRAQRCIAS